MNMNGFVSSLFSFDASSNANALVLGTAEDARVCVEKNRHLDGLICHYNTGGVLNQFKRSACHTFLVVPGVWASLIIRDFSSEVVKGPLFEDKDDGGEFESGALGVIVEMSFGDVFDKLKSLKPGCPYRMIRFFVLF